jgi:hypothetical protein
MPKKFIIIMILIILLTILLGSSLVLGQHPGGDPSESSEETATITRSGYCDNPQIDASGSTWTETIYFKEEESIEFTGGRITKVEFILSWVDDQGQSSDPDRFGLQTDDEMHDPESHSSDSGIVAITREEDGLNDVWNILVSCDSAGPTDVPLGPIGIITQSEPDPGNNWDLVITFTYSDSSGGPGGPPANVVAVLNSPIFKIHIALMIASTYLFLFTGIFAGIYLYTRNRWSGSNEPYKKLVSTPKLIIIVLILAFLAFFIASVPIGMWVAGMFYGWAKAWTGFPTFWNPEMYEFTNADNVSFIVLLLWAIPIYLNRQQIMKGKWFKKLFGWSNFLMKRAESTPKPKLSNFEFALSYFFMGIFVFLVFMVQPHGSGS